MSSVLNRTQGPPLHASNELMQDISQMFERWTIWLWFDRKS